MSRALGRCPRTAVAQGPNHTDRAVRTAQPPLVSSSQACRSPEAHRAAYLLLALFREVASLYGSRNASLHPTPEVSVRTSAFGGCFLNGRESHTPNLYPSFFIRVGGFAVLTRNGYFCFTQSFGNYS